MKNETKPITASTNYIAACGLYCGACRKYLNGKFRDAARTTRQLGAKSDSAANRKASTVVPNAIRT